MNDASCRQGFRLWVPYLKTYSTFHFFRYVSRKYLPGLICKLEVSDDPDIVIYHCICLVQFHHNFITFITRGLIYAIMYNSSIVVINNLRLGLSNLFLKKWNTIAFYLVIYSLLFAICSSGNSLITFQVFMRKNFRRTLKSCFYYREFSVMNGFLL